MLEEPLGGAHAHEVLKRIVVATAEPRRGPEQPGPMPVPQARRLEPEQPGDLRDGVKSRPRVGPLRRRLRGRRLRARGPGQLPVRPETNADDVVPIVALAQVDLPARE